MDVDRVFGRGRLRMVTGDHVEVYREASRPGERRRYTKRFLATQAGDFRPWTEREWRILARLVGHGIGAVPDVVRFDRGVGGAPAIVQTYDAGITVDHWATLLPVQRDGRVLRHLFDDAAHWWALARHVLMALDAIHELRLVHLDLKADNVCIPFGPADYDPHASDQRLFPRFEQLALIDFAFSLVCGDRLATALPLARQPEFDYQSPRLLNALEAARCGDLRLTQQLDWRCDLYSLAAMLRRYLPDPEAPLEGTWNAARHAQARALVRRLLEVHDQEPPAARPHGELIAMAARVLEDTELAGSLQRGWTLAATQEHARDELPTPITRIAAPLAMVATPHTAALAPRRERVRRWLWPIGAGALVALSVPILGEAWLKFAGGQAKPAIEQSVAQAPAAPEAASQPAPSPAVEKPPAAIATVPTASAPVAAPPARAALPPLAIAKAPARAATPPPPRTRIAAQPSKPAAAERRIARAPDAKPAKPAARPRALPVPAPATPVVAAASTPPPASPPMAAPAPAPVVEDPAPPAPPPDLLARANELIANEIPRLAQRAERLILRVLFAASRDEPAERDEDIRRAASALRLAPPEPLPPLSARDARQMKEAAQDAYWRRGELAEAVSLLTRALAANPLDPEVTGNLAFLRLKQQPAQPEAARQLALLALTTPQARHPYGRVEDWNTFAIASALSGRQRDARNAWLVTLALTPNVDRQCRAAVNAYARHGERLRLPVEALLQRAHESYRDERAAWCEWPPHWTNARRTER